MDSVRYRYPERANHAGEGARNCSLVTVCTFRLFVGLCDEYQECIEVVNVRGLTNRAASEARVAP